MLDFDLWTLFNLKGGVNGSAHVHESKYFFAFARYDPSLFTGNLFRCLWTIRKGIGNSGGNFFIFALFCMQITVNTSWLWNKSYGSTLNWISTIWVQSTSIFCEFWSSVIFNLDSLCLDHPLSSVQMGTHSSLTRRRSLSAGRSTSTAYSTVHQPSTVKP